MQVWKGDMIESYQQMVSGQPRTKRGFRVSSDDPHFDPNGPFRAELLSPDGLVVVLTTSIGWSQIETNLSHEKRVAELDEMVKI